jgi:hypothetical protein
MIWDRSYNKNKSGTQYKYIQYNVQNSNDVSIADFNNRLSYESWEDVINVKDVNSAFNFFLNTYLTIFHSSFP